MMDEATQNEVLLGQLRTALAAAGGALVTEGIISSGTLNIILGLVTAIVPFIWSAWSKHQAEQQAKAREAVALNVGIVVADNTVGPTPLATPAKAAAIIAAIAPSVPPVVSAAQPT